MHNAPYCNCSDGDADRQSAEDAVGTSCNSVESRKSESKYDDRENDHDAPLEELATVVVEGGLSGLIKE